jgi:cysteine dioxygenase
MRTRSGPLTDLIRALDASFAADERGASAGNLLAEYARDGDDWRRFAMFEATYYARNLVHRTAAYELIVLCWGAGQQSPIHDHQGQRCWMGVLEGDVVETVYRMAPDAPMRLVRGVQRTFPRASVAYIVDEVGWHRIEPAGGAPAVTLHLYSRPITECRTFDETTGEFGLRRLSYHSVDGIPLAASS